MKLEELLELGKEPPEKVGIEGVGPVYLQMPTAGDFERIKPARTVTRQRGRRLNHTCVQNDAAVLVDKNGKRLRLARKRN